MFHRDVSEGNVLFSEVHAGKAFLVDWDYAEFTPEGLRNFNKWFPEKQNSQYDTLDKSLKDMTVRDFGPSARSFAC